MRLEAMYSLQDREHGQGMMRAAVPQITGGSVVLDWARRGPEVGAWLDGWCCRVAASGGRRLDQTVARGDEDGNRANFKLKDKPED